MRFYLFKKANYLKDKIEVLAITPYAIRLKVNNFEVEAKYQNHRLIFLCSCNHGAVERICAHTIAACYYLTKNGEKLEDGEINRYNKKDVERDGE